MGVVPRPHKLVHWRCPVSTIVLCAMGPFGDDVAVRALLGGWLARCSSQGGPGAVEIGGSGRIQNSGRKGRDFRSAGCGLDWAPNEIVVGCWDWLGAHDHGPDNLGR